MDGQVTWLDLGISCGKTWSEPSVATKEKTSRQSSKKSSKSSSRKPPVLKCLKRAGLPGGGTTMKWEDDGAWCGELTTRNTGECPNVAVVSRLSQILEETPHPKYNLTAKACQGILRRAERRGKDLPKLLKEVLIRQSQGASPQEWTEAPAPTETPISYAVRIRGGCDGGGKGALVQTEKSGTLGCGNDQTIFCMATQQGGAELRTDDRAPTLTAAAGMSGNNQPVVCAGFKAGQGAQAGGIGYCEEVSPTLAAAPSGTNQTPAAMAFDTTQITSKENGSQPEFGKPCHSLNANAHVPCVALDMTHACDVIRECGEQVPALQARMGTGGNQVPLTYQMQGFGDYREGTTASSCKQRDYKDGTDLVCSSVDCRNFTEGGELNGTLQAKESGGSSLNLNNTVRQNMVVRRLTPLECTRLQGYPDGWVDIGDWVDEQGKKHKEADRPKYKALGNSIALPFWQWMIDRMAKYLPENATLGSLFDGIGGFPLCWSRTHSPECCRWASEIEPFPIAVTKMRFGED